MVLNTTPWYGRGTETTTLTYPVAGCFHQVRGDGYRLPPVTLRDHDVGGTIRPGLVQCSGEVRSRRLRTSSGRRGKWMTFKS
jgi:hypothetical protein